MSENEYLIMDQLYFVTSYEDIKEGSALDDAALVAILWGLINKEWVKCLDGPEIEVTLAEDEFMSYYAKYHYLATKQGLLEHNMR